MVSKDIDSTKMLNNLFENMDEGFALHEIILDGEGIPCDYRFIKVNKAFEKMTGLIEEEIRGRTVREVIPNTERYWIDTYGRVALTGESVSFSNYSAGLDKHFKVNVYSPSPYYFATIFMDITFETKALEQIKYLSYHDQLTGLYNRHFYVEELNRLDVERNLPFTIAMIDVNGLKLTNDAFGHEAGDRLLKTVGDILKEECRADDIVCRFGGDEFVILLPKTSHRDAEALVKRIYGKIGSKKIENIIVSASIGWGTKTNRDEEIRDILSKAEDHMYKKKVTESQTMRIETIGMIMQTLHEADFSEKLHAERVSCICREIGRAIGLDAETIRDLETAGFLHDIGKIAIDRSLLTKKEELSDVEFIEVNKHSDISYQILKSADIYARLAEGVLSHHEKWDGTGYPRELSGKKIPLIGRVIALADAYEAMTSGRPYKKAISHEKALEEIKRCSGSQFDPKIVQAFLSLSFGEMACG